MAPMATSPVEPHPRQNGMKTVSPRLYSLNDPPSLHEFEKLCSQQVSREEYPLAAGVSANIPIYDLADHDPTHVSLTTSLQDEWYQALLSGPGVIVLKNFLQNPSLIDRVNSVYECIINSELEANGEKGDHFAASGNNSRIWNSFQKHALLDPKSFVEYYSNPWLSLVSEAWLGPGFRVTAQVNIVRPGGAAQVSHRDYHLGFQTAAACARFPRAMQIASQLLTLQGGVAHTDMPLESGPTRFLPFSQTFEEGFMAYRLPEFKQYFENHWVSLPLAAGDAVFFNPALFHAAGENRTEDVDRCANLLQISSAFGKTMESLDSLVMVEKCWNIMREKYQREGPSREMMAVVTAVSEGYPFPTNLDRRPPAPGGMAPESEAELLLRGLEEDWATAGILRHLRKLREDSLSS